MSAPLHLPFSQALWCHQRVPSGGPLWSVNGYSKGCDPASPTKGDNWPGMRPGKPLWVHRRHLALCLDAWDPESAFAEVQPQSEWLQVLSEILEPCKYVLWLPPMCPSSRYQDSQTSPLGLHLSRPWSRPCANPSGPHTSPWWTPTWLSQNCRP